MAPLLFGVRLSLSNFVKEQIDEVDLDKTTTEELKSILSKMPTVNLEVDDIELVHCGNVLKQNIPLSGSGVKPGHMVHVLKKREKELPVSNENMSEKESVSIVVAFLALTLNPNSKNELQKIRSLLLENITSMTPSLRKDPIALTFLQDPELLGKLGDVETIKRVIKQHPALVEAASYIVASSDSKQRNDLYDLNSTSHAFNNLSDDEEMDSSQSSDSFVTPSSSSRQNITTAQLAAALAAASGSVDGASTSTSRSSGEITPAMLTEAMQQAINPFSTENTITQGSNHEAQMQQMVELGFTDNVINSQALQMTNGDVHAAVELVLSGALSNDL